MIYLVGGAPRSGKSTFAKLLSQKLKISLIETDLLTHVFQENSQEYGLTTYSDYTLRKTKFDPILKSLNEPTPQQATGYQAKFYTLQGAGNLTQRD